MSTGRLITREEFEKQAALGADLRIKGLGGVKRPPFPTEGTKNTAFGLLRNSQKPTQFKGMAKPSTLVKPGPSIQQVAPTPTPL